MADDIRDRLTNWVRDAADVAGDAAKRVAEVTTDAADTISEKYGQSPLQEKMDNAVGWTKEQLHRSGVAAATKTVTEKTSDVLDTVSGQKILELLEDRNVLQDKYNDILATKLEEALRRIEALEKLLPKLPSS
jgi:hypothetical protein